MLPIVRRRRRGGPHTSRRQAPSARSGRAMTRSRAVSGAAHRTIGSRRSKYTAASTMSTAIALPHAQKTTRKKCSSSLWSASSSADCGEKSWYSSKLTEAT
eukprot:192694-Prymnesium_polylepis.1